MAFDRLKQIAEDLITLEVTTLTSVNNTPISLVADDIDDTPLVAAKNELSAAKTQLVADIQAGDSATIKASKQKVKDAEGKIRDLEKALGVYDPKDIFSRIQGQLGTNENIQLVAYSRFEIEGDSVNYVNNNDALKGLVSSHGELVAASQESRKALFEFVRNL
ncbi:hypothetical protein EYS14_11015 [Alteromonadaceae bacterium M269]|nr:hypothetical protein EYS14_11015 [Alteromonadaceae bacterium M269]